MVERITALSRGLMFEIARSPTVDAKVSGPDNGCVRQRDLNPDKELSDMGAVWLKAYSRLL